MASHTRDTRITDAVACPTCGAGIGIPCRNPVPHQLWRGAEDHRLQPLRPHTERRLAWIEQKRRSALARALQSLRKSHGGGRPRTVPHNRTGPCRCSDCRRKPKPKPSAH